MPEGDTESSRPSLELPKLGRRRPKPPAPEPPAPEPLPVEAQSTTQVETETKPERPRRVRPERKERRPRGPGGMPAAVLVGVVVGLGIVGLTWASLRGCEAVQGTSSCGGVGYLLLSAILVAMVVVGALLLRLVRVPEPASTSFLAVGLTAVLALMFLIDSMTDRAMIVVIPLLSAGAFAAAHWVTRTFVEPPTN